MNKMITANYDELENLLDFLLSNIDSSCYHDALQQIEFFKENAEIEEKELEFLLSNAQDEHAENELLKRQLNELQQHVGDVRKTLMYIMKENQQLKDEIKLNNICGEAENGR